MTIRWFYMSAAALLLATRFTFGDEPSRHGFVVPDDLRFELLLSEPDVRQPVHLSFDERGRLWVVQFLQYPAPAGLKVLSRDGYWRAQYDKIPPPPPNHFVGADKITIHEDTDGDGRFDTQKTFLEGLNIATSVCRGRGGVWITNPPYLLFYPDRNNDDVPDGDPEVHLEGFGLEDTHSVVNSLCWGPDGWLYAAQGSTVTGDVKRPNVNEKPVHTLGQLIWRYHPETKRYEVFAEGGGNAFGLEMDTSGRIFSGHNGGDTRGFHYVQGGYLQKGFGKHGPLSNPYTFGYFPAMQHNQVPRFTHTFVIYDGNALPDRYLGKLFGVAPLLHHVVMSDVEPIGSTFKTHDIGHAVTTDDPQFIPADIKQGPDGALYVADWYDKQCAHTKSAVGEVDKSNGRVYRLAGAKTTPTKPQDLSKLSSLELIGLLKDPNKWKRQTALRLLADRRDPSVVGTLQTLLAETKDGLALEALWALYLSGGLDESVAIKTLGHANAQVRLWTVRLVCDEKQVSSAIASQLIDLASKETDLEVRNQLACSARRLPARDDLAIVRKLLERSEDAADSRIPLLLWWAIEAKVAEDPSAVVAMFNDASVWRLPIVEQHILERLMRRFAATGKRQDLVICAQLFKLAPSREHAKRLMTGLEAAYAGRPLTNLPLELATAMAEFSGSSIVLGLRQGRPDAVAEAIKIIADEKADKTKQLQYIQVLGEVSQPQCVPSLIGIVVKSTDSTLRGAALLALARYDNAQISDAILGAYPAMADDVRAAAHATLTTRPQSTLALLQAVDAGRVGAATIPLDIVSKMSHFPDEQIAKLLAKHWPGLVPHSSDELKAEISRVARLVRSGDGTPVAGQKLFENQCGKCHMLFGVGGKVGPDLTSFKRDNLDSMLVNIINPNAEIREGFGTYFVTTSDGRVLTGLLVEQDTQVVVLRTPEGIEVPISRGEIDEMSTSSQSMMPEGLLKQYTDQQLRDLFAFLRMTQPVIK